MRSGVELLQAYAGKGEEEAFAELVARFVNLVYSIARRRLENAALAEEAVQLVFIRLARSRPRFATEGKMVGWLHRTATNVTIDLWRAESRRRAREKEGNWMQNPADENLEVMARALDEAIDKLGENEREAILLRFFAKRRMSEVGEALGVSEDAAKMRVSRAVASLRQRLARAGVVCGSIVLTRFLTARAVEAAPFGMVEQMKGLGAGTQIGAGTFTTSARLAALLFIAGLGTFFVTQFVASETKLIETPQRTIENVVINRIEAAVRSESGSRMVVRLVSGANDGPVTNGVIVAEYFTKGRSEKYFLTSGSAGLAEIPHPTTANPLRLYVTVTSEGFVPVGRVWVDDSELEQVRQNPIWGYEGLRYERASPISTATNLMATLPKETKFWLDEARTFSGNILDEDGAPVPGVLIRVRSPNNFIFYQDEQSMMSDAGGNWRIPFVPKWWSETPVFLDKEGFATTLATIPTRDNDPTTLDLVIKRGVMVTGRVEDSSGQAVPNAQLREIKEEDVLSYKLPERAATSETDGRYVLEKMLTTEPLERILIEAKADGFVSRIREVKLPGPTNVLDFTLSKPSLLRGRVIDGEGAPVAGARVQTITTNYFQEYKWGRNTDNEGRFEWAAAPKEANYRVTVTVSRRRVGQSGADTYTYSLPPLDLVLKADGVEREIVVPEELKK